MRLLLNILWLLFGGLFSALGWVLTGCLWCITVVGIPVGLQCFKLASISLDPFGKEIVYDDENAVSFLLNILWIIFGGIEMAIGNALIGIILCITIIGIPWGKQYFKIAKLSLMPFGARVEREHIL
ncbi:MAG: YccF domain-containing protein [Lachnospiraceae bacterium]